MSNKTEGLPNFESFLQIWTQAAQAVFAAAHEGGSLSLADVQIPDLKDEPQEIHGAVVIWGGTEGVRGGYILARVSALPGMQGEEVSEPPKLPWLGELFAEVQRRLGTGLRFELQPEAAASAAADARGPACDLSLRAVEASGTSYLVSFHFTPAFCASLGPIELGADGVEGLFSGSPAAPVGRRDGPHRNIDRILDIELGLTVSFGQTRMLLKDVMQLGAGSIVELGQLADEPVDLWVNNRRVARGEVVIVGGNYGVRIMEIDNVTDRIHTLGG